MKTIQIIKNVNNTEVGKGGTHETYILVQQELDVSDLFPIQNQKVSFYDPIKKKYHNIRLTIGREKRIVGLGPFYRDYDTSAGDEVVLQKTVLKDKNEFKIFCRKHLNSIVISRLQDGFEVLTPERMNLITNNSTILVGGAKKKIELNYKRAVKKRADSPTETKIYDLAIDSTSVSENYISGSIIELVANNDLFSIVTPIAWKKQIIQSEE